MVDGVLLLDKPVGPSSQRVLGHVKHLLGAKKAGHAGTLDPMASGLLPILLGDATKYAAQGLDADKTYLAEIFLGVRTRTGDREGEILQQAEVPPLDQSAVTAACARFLGKGLQVPPMYSAIKKDGRALYDYARSGQEVVREPRAITIHEIELIRFASPVLAIRVVCSKGTYIRTLAEDIGAALGCPAHLQSLRRIGVGPIQAPEIVALESIERAAQQERLLFLKPVDWLIRDWPEVVIDRANAERFFHGQTIPCAGSLPLEQCRVRNESGEFLGTGRLDAAGLLHPTRVRSLNS
jgi:tRNA pseudouridine55 synthase